MSAVGVSWDQAKAEKLSHRNALSRLKSLGFAPGVIYDIGACRGGWTRLASEVFPGAQFVLFEANADHTAELAALGHRHVIAALGAADGDRRAFHVPRAGDVTGASLYVETIAHYKASDLDLRELATVRLDTLVARERLAAPDFVKIDVQGAELDVLAGARETLRDSKGPDRRSLPRRLQSECAAHRRRDRGRSIGPGSAAPISVSCTARPRCSCSSSICCWCGHRWWPNMARCRRRALMAP